MTPGGNVVINVKKATPGAAFLFGAKGWLMALPNGAAKKAI